jgi:hypothetical protein
MEIIIIDPNTDEVIINELPEEYEPIDSNITEYFRTIGYSDDCIDALQYHIKKNLTLKFNILI